MGKKLKISVLVTAGTAALLLMLINKCSCGRHENESVNSGHNEKTFSTPVKFIDPFSKSFNVEYSEYEIISGRDTVLHHKSGTNIFIPSCAFRKNGEAVTGRLKIKYR